MKAVARVLEAFIVHAMELRLNFEMWDAIRDFCQTEVTWISFPSAISDFQPWLTYQNYLGKYFWETLISHLDQLSHKLWA